ncbi:MAG TPA: BON domain-containing protein [Methylomirabilota bacterium]|jgi:hypothetical protein|nr:BON domain-containing protein [Methylomirabilota bacterium]
MEPLERRYFGDDRPNGRRRRKRAEPRVGWQIGPGVEGPGDTTLVPGPPGAAPLDEPPTDEGIADDVRRWMAEDGRLDTRAVDVHVQNGEVTLEGLVSRRGAKRLAGDIAAAVPGVRSVVNRLRTGPRRAA